MTAKEEELELSARAGGGVGLVVDLLSSLQQTDHRDLRSAWQCADSDEQLGC